MKTSKEDVKKLCIDYLLDQVKDNKTIKEEVTVAKYEQFQNWIKNLDYNTVSKLIFLTEKSSNPAEARTALLVKKQKLECLKKCGKDKECLQKCLIYLYQHIIGAVKTVKSKCKDKRCMDRMDKQIEKFADKITALGKK
jgi:hypothetical protein